MFSVTAVYLLIDQINKKLCETCTNKCSCGLFAIYISVDKNTFFDVYINCQYSSDIGKYSLKGMSLGKCIRSSINIYKVRTI